MDDQQVGIAIRTVRIRRRKRQRDIATEARVSASTVSRIERGRLDEVAVGTLRRVCARLELRVDVRVRSRGGDLDRMVSARHARLVEAIVARLRLDTSGWEVVPEASFSIWGERGVIDILAWHAGRRALLVIEVKTEIVDVGEMLGTLDRKRRLAREVAVQRGWDPDAVSAWLVVAESRTNERRIAAHRETLRAAYPEDGRRMRAWLAQPQGSVAAMSTWREDAKGTAPIRRVRVTRGRASNDTLVPSTAPKSARRSPGDR
jgi:transcriptional regulator with XRE-family HTH domain